MPPLNITVNGDATLSKPAERAVVFLAVSADGLSQSVVSEKVTGASNEMQRRLKGMKDTTDAPITYWTMTALSTSSYQPARSEKDGQKSTPPPRQFTACTRFEIKFKDFAALPPFITPLLSTPHISITTLSWRLTSLTSAELASQSRKDAVKKAVAKANDYSTAAGKKTLVLVDISENENGGYYGGGMMRSAAFGGGGGGGAQQEQLSLEPEDVEVSCSIKVVFVADD